MRKKTIGEGIYKIQIKRAESIKYDSGREALKLGVETDSGIYGNYNIFTNNIYLIDKLINLVYEEVEEEELDEQDFVGVDMMITTKVSNGYINIVDINPLEDEI